MEVWKAVFDHIWALFLVGFAWLLRSGSARLDRVESKVISLSEKKVDRDEHKELSQRLREDIQGVHKKMDTNDLEARKAMAAEFRKVDENFRQLSERLDKLLG